MLIQVLCGLGVLREVALLFSQYTALHALWGLEMGGINKKVDMYDLQYPTQPADQKDMNLNHSENYNYSVWLVEKLHYLQVVTNVL